MPAGAVLPEGQKIRGRSSRSRNRFACIAAGVAVCCSLGGCADTLEKLRVAGSGKASRTAEAPQATPTRAATDAILERELERLRAELREAEAAMAATESGLRGDLSRADAVSILAEARIEVERASRDQRWSRKREQAAQEKLAEAERQFQAGHIGSTVFFASRAHHIAAQLNAVAKRVANTPDSLVVNGRSVNLRAGPSTRERVLQVLVASTPVFPVSGAGEWLRVQTASGQEGWVHGSLLRTTRATSSEATTQSLPASLAR